MCCSEGREHTAKHVAADTQGFVRELPMSSLVAWIVDLVSGLPVCGDEPVSRCPHRQQRLHIRTPHARGRREKRLPSGDHTAPCSTCKRLAVAEILSHQRMPTPFRPVGTEPGQPH